MKCPECRSDNPDTQRFCGECGAQLMPSEEISVSPTKTLETPKEELSTGSTFAGRYQIIEQLGTGGMGKVYRAVDKKLNEEITLKLIKPEIASDKKTVERFSNELKLARKIVHKNVGRMYELMEAEGIHFITMEYVPGQDLEGLIRQTGQLTIGKAISVAKQVCEGLAEAHRLGVVHRDLKPGNIMIDKEGNARIMDFGIARSVRAKGITAEGMIIGTPEYMSPEQAEAKEVDSRSDIYSLGVVLYEMVTGRAPFKGETPLSVAMKHKSEKPPDPRELNAQAPLDLSQVILRCMEKDKEKRYQSSEELISELTKIEKGIPATERIFPKRKPPALEAVTERVSKIKWSRAILYGGAGILLILIIVAGLSLLTGQREAIESIAVLPLENLSGDTDQEYFADGMTDALIAELGKIRALRVISRQSVMQYKGSTKPMPEIARELNVDGVIEGTVLLVGQRVRITAQLIEAREDRHLWSDNYEGDLRDVLVLQSEVARAIAREVKITVTQEEQAHLASAAKVNPEAYQLYLKGNYFLKRLTPEGIQKSLEYFQQAIKKDPTCAWAYKGIAGYYVTLGFFDFLPPRVAFPKAKKAAEKALELDDTLAEAHQSMASVKLHYDWDWMGAERAFKRAIELNPNSAGAHLGYGMYLTAIGKHDESIAEAKRAMELDPLSLTLGSALAATFMMARRYDQAIEEYQRVLEMRPNYWEPRVWLALIYLQKEMYSEAVAEVQKGMELLKEAPLMMPAAASVYASSGKRDKARKLLDELIKLSKKRYVSPVWIALIFKSFGQNDRAFEWLEKAYEERDHWMIYFKVTPFIDSLRPDDRYAILLKKMGLEE
jgi:serine/threonine protein kinase/tetratricopeptide (TPR) repeat protein